MKKIVDAQSTYSDCSGHSLCASTSISLTSGHFWDEKNIHIVFAYFKILEAESTIRDQPANYVNFSSLLIKNKTLIYKIREIYCNFFNPRLSARSHSYRPAVLVSFRGSRPSTVLPLHAKYKISIDRSDRRYYLQKNPGQLGSFLSKLFVFAYTWSIGGNFRRQDDQDDEFMRKSTADRSKQASVDVANDFDHLMHETFDVEPPLGRFSCSFRKKIFETGGFISLPIF